MKFDAFFKPNFKFKKISQTDGRKLYQLKLILIFGL